MAQRVEERGLPGVGVANKRDRPERNGIARITAQRALFPYFVDRFLNLRDSIANPPPVGLKFLFTGTTNADTACATAGAARSSTAAFPTKTRHCCALASQPRQHVVELRKLHLQLAFAAPRVLSKNIENELRPIDHPAFSDRFNVPLLHRREIAVENDERRFVCGSFSTDFI